MSYSLVQSYITELEEGKEPVQYLQSNIIHKWYSYPYKLSNLPVSTKVNNIKLILVMSWLSLSWLIEATLPQIVFLKGTFLNIILKKILFNVSGWQNQLE